jgi:hypothetical protein
MYTYRGFRRTLVAQRPRLHIPLHHLVLRARNTHHLLGSRRGSLQPIRTRSPRRTAPLRCHRRTHDVHLGSRAER